MIKNVTKFNIHGFVELDFGTDDDSFMDFVYQNYRIFASDSTTSQQKLKVDVFFNSDPGIPDILEKKISRYIYLGNKSLLYLHPRRFRIYLYENEDSLRIVTDARKINTISKVSKGIIKEVIRILLTRNIHRTRDLHQQVYQIFANVMRQSLHLPLFYLLEKRGFILLHGAAVAKNSDCFLLLGLNAIGKTTLAINLVFRKNFNFLTNDFLLIMDDVIYCFPERVKLTQYTLDYLGMEEAGVKIHSKYEHSLPEEQIKTKATPTKVFFIGNSAEAAIEEIDAKKALKQINAAHSYLAEFPEHSYPAFLPTFPDYSEIQSRTYNFLKSKKIYNLYLSRNHAENMELLLAGTR